MKTFKFNGETVTPRALTFNDICQLEEMGVDISEIGSHTMSFMRAFLALWINKSLKEAGDMIEEHVAKGGEISVLMDAITVAMNESGFFNSAGKKKAPLKIVEATESDT